MSLQTDELSTYLARTGYAAPREPTFAVLSAIIAGHVSCIPFENLDVLLERPVNLDTQSLLAKLVRQRRGGYCFEHNTLLLLALRAIGFAAHGFAARVLWGRKEGEIRPRTHMLLRVMLPEGEFIADVGFGGLTLTGPLRFDVGAEQGTPHEPHRLVPADGEVELQARLDGAWTQIYRFPAGDRQHPIDYEMANWFTSTHPTSLFKSVLMTARAEPDRRYTMLNRDFTIRHRDGRVARRQLRDADDLGEVLFQHFHVEMPDRADLATVWQRIGG